MIALAVRLCVPMLVVVAALLAASLSREVRNWAVWPFWVLWIGAMLIAGVVWPRMAARSIAEKCEPRASRAAKVRRVVAGAMMVNVVVAALGIIAFRAVL